MNSDSLKTVDKNLILRVAIGILLVYFAYISIRGLGPVTVHILNDGIKFTDGRMPFFCNALIGTILYIYSLFIVALKWKNPNKIHAASVATIIAAIVYTLYIAIITAIFKFQPSIQVLLYLLPQFAIPFLFRVQLKNLGGLPKKEYSFPASSPTHTTATMMAETTTPGGMSESLYAAFIGGDGGYYMPKFARFAAIGGNFGFSFNLFGFIFPTAWLFYRKMYLWGIVMLVLTSMLNIIGWLLSGLIIGFSGNWLYFSHASKKLALLGEMENAEQAASMVGGTNVILASIILFLNIIVVAVAFTVIGMFVS